MTNFRSRSLILVAAFFLALVPVLGQTTASIRGTVTDPSGAVIPGAKVTLINVGTGLAQTTTTDQLGIYTLTLLPVGTYKLRVESSGFKVFEQSPIPLAVNQVLGLNVALQVGGVSQTVQVSGGAPLVNTQTTEVGTLVGKRDVTELPLNGRNVIQLATLTPGISAAQVHTIMTGCMEYCGDNSSRMSVNGNRMTMGEYMLDGTYFSGPVFNSGINYPNPDSLAQFRFISSDYSAEYGKNPGGIMNAVTKSGTNSLHGGAWEFNRNSSLGSRGFFDPNVPFLNQNQFGFDLGGPIKRNKLFAFGTAQWMRVRSAAASTDSFVPNAAERTGDLSDPVLHPNPIVDPLHPDPTDPLHFFPGNIIPTDRLDPVALNYMKLLPLPNQPDGRWAGSAGAPTNNYQWMAKTDYNISSRHRITGSFFQDKTLASSLLDFGRLHTPLTSAATGQVARLSDTLIRDIIFQDTFAFRSDLVNQFRIAYVRFDASQSNLPGRGPSLSELGSNYPQFIKDIPQISVTGRFFNSGGNWSIGTSHDWQFGDNINYIRGRHNLKIGGEVRRREYLSESTANSEGAFGFTGQITGDPLADYLLGQAWMYSSNSIQQDSNQNSFAAYVQDDYKVSRRVVLNLGLRYERYTPWEPKKNVAFKDGGSMSPVATMDPARFYSNTRSSLLVNAPPGMGYPGEFGIQPGVYGPDPKWEPRFGVAWDVFGDGKTSVRAGWGLFGTTPYGETTTNNIYSAPFFINFYVPLTPSLVNPFPPAAAAAFPPVYTKNFDFTPFLPLNIQANDTNMKNADIQQFNFTVQRELPGMLSVQVAYVGNVSHHLYLAQLINPAVYIPGTDPATGLPLSSTGNTQARREFTLSGPQPAGGGEYYGNVGWGGSGANSNYHSLQVEVRKSLSHGLTFLTSYTWSKAIDDGTVFLSNEFAGGASQQNGLCTSCERALSNYDQGQKFVQSFVYDTPAVAAKLGADNRGVRYLLDNWEVGAIFTMGSGFPFTVGSGHDNSLTAYNHDRPNLVGNPYLSTSRPRAQLIQQYFNTGAFVANPTGTFGNLGRNTMIGPGSATLDFSLFKNLPITERLGTIQLRFESFNFLNQVRFGSPQASLAAPATEGRITTAGPGRIIQLAGKWTF